MKKRLKGVTLMEIILSLAIFAVLSMLLVQIMATVNAMMRNTNQLNRRLSYEAKFADNGLATSEFGSSQITAASASEDVRITWSGGQVSLQQQLNDNALTAADLPTIFTAYQNQTTDINAVNYQFMVFPSNQTADTIPTTNFRVTLELANRNASGGAVDYSHITRISGVTVDRIGGGVSSSDATITTSSHVGQAPAGGNPLITIEIPYDKIVETTQGATQGGFGTMDVTIRGDVIPTGGTVANLQTNVVLLEATLSFTAYIWNPNHDHVTTFATARYFTDAQTGITFQDT